MINRIRANKIMRGKWAWKNWIKLCNIQISLNSNKYCYRGLLQCQNFQIWQLQEFELFECTGWLHMIRTSSPCLTVLKAKLGAWQPDKTRLCQPLVISNSKIACNENVLYGFHFHDYAWFVLKPKCTLQHPQCPG